MDVSAELRHAMPGRVMVLNGALDEYAPNTGERVLNGVRSYDASSFLDQMQTAEPRVWDAIDIWAAHAYPLGPFTEEPGAREFRIDDLSPVTRTEAQPWPGLFNRGINSYQWELYKLRSYGVTRDLQVFITETGWRQRESPSLSIDRPGRSITGQAAARYLLLSFYGDPLAPREYTWTPWDVDADVGAVMLFALDGHPERWDQTNLVDVGEDGRILGFKPAFAPLTK